MVRYYPPTSFTGNVSSRGKSWLINLLIVLKMCSKDKRIGNYHNHSFMNFTFYQTLAAHEFNAAYLIESKPNVHRRNGEKYAELLNLALHVVG